MISKFVQLYQVGSSYRSGQRFFTQILPIQAHRTPQSTGAACVAPDDKHKQAHADVWFMKLDNILAGDANSCFIAEAGINHNGDIDMAEDMVRAAADAGADAVKFQTFSADRLVTRTAETAAYQQESGESEVQYEMLQRYEMDRDAHERLQAVCRERDVTFLSTPFDAQSADMLADIGVPAFKIGSGELDNHPLLEHVAGFGRPMIVSTGMGTMDEVLAARDIIRAVDSSIELVFLHCTSAYPCEAPDVNLRAMETMDERLEESIGFSDHTVRPETAALAVAAGARVVEKHFTLDKTLPGPDHQASLEPDELKASVGLVEFATIARGNPTKQPTVAELTNKPAIRKSLHAAVDIPEGTVLSEEHVEIIRPGDGLSPKHYRALLGSTTNRDLVSGDSITADVVTADLRGGDNV